MFGSFFKFIENNFDEFDNALTKTSDDCKAFLCSNEKNNSYEDYCSYHQRCLSKLREKESVSTSDIRRLETFETWFNGNCGYVVIERNSSLIILLVIYEPAIRSMSENLSVHDYSSRSNDLGTVLRVARLLKEKLQNNDFHVAPIIDIYGFSNQYMNFAEMLLNCNVIKKDLPHSYEPGFWRDRFGAPSNAEDYLKPLDIVWIGRRHFTGVSFYHVGIYLGKGNEGKNWMCHLDDDRGAKITDWRSFLEAGRCEELIRYHPIIPFKSYSKITKQIAWAVDGIPYRRGNYSLADRNCEHFANMCVYGINYSGQVYDSSILKGNDGKGSTFKLTSEMNESNDKLGWKTNDWSKWIENQAKIEVPSKQECRIM